MANPASRALRLTEQNAEHDRQGEEKVGVFLHHKEQSHGHKQCRDDIEPGYFRFLLHNLFVFSNETLAVFDNENRHDREQEGT